MERSAHIGSSSGQQEEAQALGPLASRAESPLALQAYPVAHSESFAHGTGVMSTELGRHLGIIQRF